MGTQDQDLADGCPSDEDTSDVGSYYSTLSYSDIQSTSNPHPSASFSHSPTISTSEPIVNQPPSKRIHKSATSESEIELSNTVRSGFKGPGDAESTFGNQVAAELRQINENKSQKMYYDSFVWHTRARSKFDLPCTLPARNTLPHCKHNLKGKSQYHYAISTLTSHLRFHSSRQVSCDCSMRRRKVLMDKDP